MLTAYERSIREKIGRDLDDGERWAAVKEIGRLDDDGRLARAKELGMVLVAREKASPTGDSSKDRPKRFGEMTSDELDAVVKLRLGREPHTLLASERRKYHDALRAQDPRRPVRTALQKHAEAVGEEKLSPEARITLYRQRQRAAKG